MCHEIFDLQIFSWFEPIWAPDKHAEIFQFLKSYAVCIPLRSQTPRCASHHGVELCGVHHSAESITLTNWKIRLFVGPNSNLFVKDDPYQSNCCRRLAARWRSPPREFSLGNRPPSRSQRSYPERPKVVDRATQLWSSLFDFPRKMQKISSKH